MKRYVVLFVMLSVVCTSSVQAAESSSDTTSVDRITCKGKAWPWGLECWNKHEGQKFSQWLRDHGANPFKFKEKWPQLARTFGKYWPGENWARLERDWHAGLQWAANQFGVSYSWLHSCNHSEGGHSMIWNHQGSGAFGPMQFMEGTFSGFSRHGFDALRARGVRVPTEYRRWDSFLGQAIAAAWAFDEGLSYHWTGAGC